jgi:hypothetical protein
MIQDKLLIVVDANPQGETPPQFLHSKFTLGILWVRCANESSKAWLMQVIGGLGGPWKGTELTVVEFKDLPKGPKVIMHIPDTTEATTVSTCVQIQNPELETTDWSVMSHKVAGREQKLALSIDPNSFKALNTLNFKAFWGLGRITFRTLKEEKRKPEDESTAS